ncbi:MAG: glycosyltransferase [Bacilli bacterium]|nr:glycosyltransferase [Bacilli bacterium]
MKKIIFLQIKGKSLGGVWFVNKTLADGFMKKGYEVKILSIRNEHPGDDIEASFDIEVVNEKDMWDRTHKGDVVRAFGHKNFFQILKKYFVDKKRLNKDYELMKEKIREYEPDYIFASHYETLKGVPSEYLFKVMFVQHSSFHYLLKDKNNVRVLKKLNNKIHGFYWLSKSAMKAASDFGYKKNNYIYNPVRFSVLDKADVINNKKIVVISRISYEKRIDLMIKIVNEVFKNSAFNNWKFEIYGIGEFSSETKVILKNSKQIFYKGVTDNPKDILLTGSLTLNTSLYEGFSLSVIEGFECGLPIISFNFGEAAYEQIIDNSNGFVAKDEDEFKKYLSLLMSDEKLLSKLSDGAKEFAKKFEIDNIISNWENVFLEIDKSR